MKPQRLVTLLYTILILAILCSLPGCMYSSAAMTGAQAVYDRHNLQKQISDNYTTISAYRALYLDTDTYKDSNISVATFNDSILITGQTPYSHHKTEIELLVKKFADKRTVYNFAEIANPTSALTRASDTWITAKIKTQLIAINEVEPSKIKVITENGTVYLMGIIPHEQADIAVEVAENTSGVQSVVKIFSYLRISKT